MPDEATIQEGEYHPAADSAMAWLKGFMIEQPLEYMSIKEALASSALSGNRTAELCMSTINRLANSQPVSDRYVLGLAWMIMRIAYRETFEKTESIRIDV